MKITEQTKMIKKTIEVEEQSFILELSRKELIALAAIIGPICEPPDFFYKIYNKAEDICERQEIEYFYPQVIAGEKK